MPICYNFTRHYATEPTSRQTVDDEIREFCNIEPDTEHWSAQFETIVYNLGLRLGFKHHTDTFTAKQIEDELEIMATENPGHEQSWLDAKAVCVEFMVTRYTFRMWRGN